MTTPNEALATINENTKTPLSAKVPMHLHPDMLLPHGDALTYEPGPGTTAYASGRTALRAIHESFADMEAAHLALSVPEPGRDGARPGSVVRHQIPANRRAELRSSMSLSFDRTAGLFDQHFSAVKDSISALDDKIVATLRDPRGESRAAIQVGAELRDLVRDVPKGERFAYVASAIQDGDAELVRAVIGSHHAASRLDRKEFDILLGMARAKFAPVEYRQMTEALAVLNKMQAASATFVNRYRQLLPSLDESKQEAALRRLQGRA